MTLKKRIISGVLAGFVACSLMTPVYATDLDDAKRKAQKIEEEQRKAEQEKASLSERMVKIVDDMTQSENEMKKKEEEIELAEEKLVNAKVEEQNQYANMKKRIKHIYENGNNDFLRIFLESKSMSDVLNKAEYATKMSRYDRNMLKKLQKLVEQVESEEKALAAEYEQLHKMQNHLTEQKNEVETMIAQNQSELANLESEMAAAQDMIAKAEEAERRKQEAAQNSGSSNSGSSSSGSSSSGSSNSGSGSSGSSKPGSSVITGNGMFTHPCPGMSYQSSYFGEVRPGIDSRPHKGHDYAAPKGTPIYAAAAGRVVIAGYSNSAGNWVVINHGNGLVTKYMHMYTTPFVRAGQYVSKGQHIGGVGTTGMSTGNHLHFQVEKNGVAVNPSNYF